jgi:protein involved in polysaccharide export with SLBB domain
MTNAFTDLNDLDKYEGTITDKGIIQHTSSTSKGPRTSDVFFLRLSGLDQILATYNIEQSYYDLDSKLSVGDRVKVYFKSSPNNDKPNLSTYQIEKDGQVILGQDEYKGKEMIAGIIATLGLGLIITIGYFQDKKYRPEKKITV